jgi:hypothetical protein
VAALSAAGAQIWATAVYATYADVRAVLERLAEVLPPDLKGAAGPPARWDVWAATHDREIRRRLERGDNDTLVNWLLLGTTFTSRPRAVLGGGVTAAELPALIQQRTSDLIAALQMPGTDERRLWAIQLLRKQGYAFDSSAERERLSTYLVTQVLRVAAEQAGYAQDLAEARRLRDVSEEFAARSRLFRTRGLSLDTSFLPNVAIEQSFHDLRRRGLLMPGSVRDVAIVGPGLDFSDKSSGYDFYPQQTLQPFAIIDSLVRAGLIGDASAVSVTTLDLSPRVNEHLAAMRRRAGAGQPYVIRLPLDMSVRWRPEALAYWNAAGQHIGTTNVETGSAAGGQVWVRTVSVRPALAAQVDPQDLNIVVQRLQGRRFDLVIATNVFVYYDLLDQVLAVWNVGAMLRRGGFLLSNNALLELPSSPLRSIGYLTVQYSDRPDDGDHIIWYQRQ